MPSRSWKFEDLFHIHLLPSLLDILRKLTEQFRAIVSPL